MILGKHAIDGVIHFTADSKLESCVIAPGQFVNNNMANGITLLDVMRKSGCNRMIFCSQAAIYSESRRNPDEENMPVCRLTPMGNPS